MYNEYVSESDYKQFLEWKRKTEEEEREREQRQKVKQLRQQQRDDFLREKKIDACLMEGISSGKTWTQFFRETQCPLDLQSRYLELQKQSGIAPGSVSSAEDEFLRGFNRDI